MTRRLPTLLLMALVCLTGYATDRALLVGIGHYDPIKTGWPVVHGDRDVELLRPLLECRGFTDMVTLTDSEATKAAIVGQLKQLAERCEAGDRVFFLFSGHGQPVRDDNKDEPAPKRYDESISPYDACRDSRKMGGRYEGQNHLIDDELCPLLDAVKRRLSPDGELFVAVDACYSRGVEKNEFTDLDPEIVRYIRGTNHPFTPPVQSTYLTRIPRPEGYTPGARMYVATACAADERNFEYKTPSGRMYGALSYYIYTYYRSIFNSHFC